MGSFYIPSLAFYSMATVLGLGGWLVWPFSLFPYSSFQQSLVLCVSCLWYLHHIPVVEVAGSGLSFYLVWKMVRVSVLGGEGKTSYLAITYRPPVGSC